MHSDSSQRPGKPGFRRSGVEIQPRGIVRRHSRSCMSVGENCCLESFQAWVYDRDAQKKIRRTFSGATSFDDAMKWRADMIDHFSPGDASSTREYAVANWVEYKTVFITHEEKQMRNKAEEVLWETYGGEVIDEYWNDEREEETCQQIQITRGETQIMPRVTKSQPSLGSSRGD